MVVDEIFGIKRVNPSAASDAARQQNAMAAFGIAPTATSWRTAAS
jgi:hypothetical protein